MTRRPTGTGPQFDQIGYWSEVKLDIIRDYAQAYSTIMAAQPGYMHHAYVDGFSGPGQCISRRSGEWVRGSPLNALNVRPKFERYFLIDLDGDKVEHLRKLINEEIESDPSLDIRLWEGDCNRILLEEVFPLLQYKDFWRALCVLDPYGLDLKWEVIKQAGQMETIDLFLNFPTMAMNREVLWTKASVVDEVSAAKMTSFWGDESWREAAYIFQPDLFGGEQPQKLGNEQVVSAFRKRLQEVAGFKYVPEPLPMRNSKGAVVYYLFFASPKAVAANIIKDLFDKYRNRAG